MIDNLIRPVRFAKMAGVSKAAISKAVNKGRLPLVDGKIDLEHPDCVAYLELHQGQQPKKKRKRKEPDESSTKKPTTSQSKRAAMVGRRRSSDSGKIKVQPSPDEGRNGATISDVTSRRALEIEKMQQNNLRLRLSNRREIGELVRREDVVRGIFGPIETTFVRLLTDMSKSMAGQILPMVQSGSTAEEIEIFVREQHSAVLKNLKRQMTKALNDTGKAAIKRGTPNN